MVNDDLKTVTVDGEPVKLTPIEYNILVLLIKIREKFFLLNRFMKISGTKRRLERTTQ